MQLPNLPIVQVLPALRAALNEQPNAVLSAPPGSGKSTVVPLALLDEPWLGTRKLLVLEPRRLAARAIAERMADLLNEDVGQTVGYRVRQEQRVSRTTRIEVVTEGILTRMLQTDPELPGAGALLFDEFHERSVHADLGLALALDVQASLRPELRILVMSATLDAERIAAMLTPASAESGRATAPIAPIITGGSRVYPVEIRYLGRPTPKTHIADAVGPAIALAWQQLAGDILVFLPGVAEIRAVEVRLAKLLSTDAPLVLPLYGNLALGQQQLALRPAPPGRRKVVLATDIAQTSLTIDGVTVVIDAGLARVPRFDPGSAMTRLDTVRVSKASADQRAGRAGRTAAGVCYRLWDADGQQRLAAHDTPEILASDLTALALELALWGAPGGEYLRWLDPPASAALAQAQDLLVALGAVTPNTTVRGSVTEYGRAMANLGTHPRLAHMMLRGKEHGQGALACLLAALLEERDVLASDPTRDDADLAQRIDLLRDPSRVHGAQRARVQRILLAASGYQRRLGISRETVGGDATGALLLYAYPDRVAMRREGEDPRYLLSNGKGARFFSHSALSQASFLVVADLDGRSNEARIYLAAAVTADEIERALSHRITNTEQCRWDASSESVLHTREQHLGALMLQRTLVRDAPEDLVLGAMLDGIREMGIAALPWTDATRQLQQRMQFVHALEGERWPSAADAALLDTLQTWLAPFLGGCLRRAHLSRVPLREALLARLTYQQQRELDALAPTHVTVPSGSQIAIDYSDPSSPVLAVKLQEMFGSNDTPRIGNGRVPLTVHLLSPARRPVQVTRDMRSFWANGYADVRKDLRGRYPRHPWPDDPLTAPPTRHAKRRQ